MCVVSPSGYVYMDHDASHLYRGYIPEPEHFEISTNIVNRLVMYRNMLPTKQAVGQHVHPRYSQYISEDNKYCLSEENADDDWMQFLS